MQSRITLSFRFSPLNLFSHKMFRNTYIHMSLIDNDSRSRQSAPSDAANRILSVCRLAFPVKLVYSTATYTNSKSHVPLRGWKDRVYRLILVSARWSGSTVLLCRSVYPWHFSNQVALSNWNGAILCVKTMRLLRPGELTYLCTLGCFNGSRAPAFTRIYLVNRDSPILFVFCERATQSRA